MIGRNTICNSVRPADTPIKKEILTYSPQTKSRNLKKKEADHQNKGKRQED